MKRRAISLRNITYDRLTKHAEQLGEGRGPLAERWALAALERDERCPEGVRDRVRKRTELLADLERESKRPPPLPPKPEPVAPPKRKPVVHKTSQLQPLSDDQLDGSGYHEL